MPLAAPQSEVTMSVSGPRGTRHTFVTARSAGSGVFCVKRHSKHSAAILAAQVLEKVQ